MPLYTYKHPKKKKFIDLVQGMNDVHEYIDEDGLKWDRVFYAPQAQIDSLNSIEKNNPKSFVEKTRNKRMTVGQMQDLSAELSDKRGGDEGDHVKKTYYDNYNKKRGGKMEHPDLKRKRIKEKATKAGVKVTF